MAINFPNSPSVSDTHVVGGTTWQWDGTAWNIVGNSIEALETAKYPVSRTELESPGKITDTLRESLTQWIDSLDRI